MKRPWARFDWQGSYIAEVTNDQQWLNQLRRTSGSQDVIEDWNPTYRGAKISVPGFYEVELGVSFYGNEAHTPDVDRSFTTGISQRLEDGTVQQEPVYGSHAVTQGNRIYLHSSSVTIDVEEAGNVLRPWFQTFSGDMELLAARMRVQLVDYRTA